MSTINITALEFLKKVNNDTSLDIRKFIRDHTVNGKKPLEWAINEPNMVLVKYIVEENIDNLIKYDVTPIIKHTVEDPVLLSFIDNHSLVNFSDEGCRERFVTEAAKSNNLRSLKVLVHKYHASHVKRTALCICIQCHRHEMYKYIVEECSYDVNDTSEVVVSTIIQYGNVMALKYLIGKGLVVKVNDSDLRWCVYYEHLDMIKHLHKEVQPLQKFVKPLIVWAKTQKKEDIVAYLESIKELTPQERVEEALKQAHKDFTKHVKNLEILAKEAEDMYHKVVKSEAMPWTIDMYKEHNDSVTHQCKRVTIMKDLLAYSNPFEAIMGITNDNKEALHSNMSWALSFMVFDKDTIDIIDMIKNLDKQFRISNGFLVQLLYLNLVDPKKCINSILEYCKNTSKNVPSSFTKRQNTLNSDELSLMKKENEELKNKLEKVMNIIG